MTSRSLQIAVYGSGGFGREAAWLVERASTPEQPLTAVCFIDDDPTRIGQTVNGLPVLNLADARRAFPEARTLAALGAPRARQAVAEKAQAAGFAFATLIHPRIELSPWVTIGEGTIICAGSLLTTNITLGRHVQINPGCTLGHDVKLADYASLAPGVHISGFVYLGQRAYVGTGAVIINGTPDAPLVIGDDVVVGAGACVTKSIPAGQTVVGVPARPISRG